MHSQLPSIDEQFVEQFGSDILNDVRAYREVVHTTVLQQITDRPVQLFELVAAWDERVSALGARLCRLKSDYRRRYGRTWTADPADTPGGPSEQRLDWGVIGKVVGRINNIEKVWMNLNKLRPVLELLNDVRV